MKKNINRREFLKRTTGITTGAIAFPYFVPSSVLGRAGTVAPSNRIVMGSIGIGTQGTGLMRGFLGHKDAQVVAVCDVYESQRQKARSIVDQHYGNEDCATYSDFREVCREGLEWQALLDGLVDYATGAGEIRRLEAELTALKPSEFDNEAPLNAGNLTDIGDLWPHMTTDERQRFVRLSLEAVVIDSDSGTVIGVLPNADYAAIFDVVAEDEGNSLGVVEWRPRADSGSAGNKRSRKLFALKRTTWS